MAKRKIDQPDLSHIHESLRTLALPVAELVPDPANARKHSGKNLAAIRGSLAQYGQRRPAVVQRKGMIVRAGNGMLQAAVSLGWTYIAAILVDEDDISATGFAIADNRTAELAEWDEEVLARLLREVEVGEESLQEMHADLAKEFDLIIGDAAGETEAEADTIPDRYQVLITCANEDSQKELIERLTKDGLECRALIA